MTKRNLQVLSELVAIVQENNRQLDGQLQRVKTENALCRLTYRTRPSDFDKENNRPLDGQLQRVKTENALTYGTRPSDFDKENKENKRPLDRQFQSGKAERVSHPQTPLRRMILEPKSGCVDAINVVMPSHKSSRKSLALYAIEKAGEAFDDVCIVSPKNTGVTDADYGSHGLILHFDNMEKSKECRVGILTVGEYENQHNARNGQGLTSLTRTNRNIKRYCRMIVASLCHLDLGHPISFLRIQAIRGARTRWHTDTMRGTTNNLVLFHNEGGRIAYRTFPAFKTSVCTFNNILCIPFSCSEPDNELMVIFLNDNKATMVNLPMTMLEYLGGYGDLGDVVVGGVKRGKLQVVLNKEGHSREGHD